MQKIFDATKCQNKVRRIAKEALEKCTEKLGEALSLADAGEGQLRGTEDKFDEAFENAARHHQLLHRRRASTSELGVPEGVMTAKGTGSGWVDCVLSFDGHLIGFEHKVARMPRHQPYGGLYDLGQITIDHHRLEMSRKLTGGYCTIVLHGPLVRDANSTLEVFRHFHNTMFIEYAVSLKWKELAAHRRGEMEHDPRGWQLRNIKRLGFDQPFWRANMRPLDFCVRNSAQTLGVIGLWAERRGRLPSMSN